MKLKSLFAMTMALTLLLSGSHVFANGNSSKNEQTNNPEVVSAYIVKDGNVVQISKAEYEQILNTSKQEESQTKALKQQLQQKGPKVESDSSGSTLNPGTNGGMSTQSLVYFYQYNQSGFTSTAYRWNLNRRITPAIYNESSTSLPNTFTSTVSETWAANISITGSGKIAAVTAGITIGGSWNQTVSGTMSLSPQIAPKKYSWIDFTPIHTNSWGYMNEKCYSVVVGSSVLLSDTNEWYDIYTPKKLTGQFGDYPDGLYTVKESDSYPTY